LFVAEINMNVVEALFVQIATTKHDEHVVQGHRGVAFTLDGGHAFGSRVRPLPLDGGGPRLFDGQLGFQSGSLGLASIEIGR